MTITVTEAKAMQQSVTQGEWSVCHSDGVVGVQADDEPDVWLAETGQSGFSDPEATARAIAAVPKMLETIIAMGEALRTIAEGDLGEVPWEENYARCQEIARDALTGANNATGK